MDEKINEIFKIASLNGFEFIYQNEGVENYAELDWDNKSITLNVCDASDEELPKILDENLSLLKDRFN